MFRKERLTTRARAEEATQGYDMKGCRRLEESGIEAWPLLYVFGARGKVKRGAACLILTRARKSSLECHTKNLHFRQQEYSCTNKL